MSEFVVITGATSGVGRAVAKRFALPADVADFDQVEAAAAAAEEALGPIDIWVSNAMTTVFSFFEDVGPDEFRRATEVTYLGAVWGTKAALNVMLPRDRGTIVLVWDRRSPSAGSRCRRRRLITAAASSMSVPPPVRRSGAASSRRGSPSGTSRGRTSTPSRPSRSSADATATSSTRSPRIPAHTAATTTGRMAGASSSGSPNTAGSWRPGYWVRAEP